GRLESSYPVVGPGSTTMEDPVPQLGDLLHQGGDDLPDGIVQGHSGEIVVRGGFGVDGDQTGTTHHGHVTQTGHRVHRQRCAHRQEDITLTGGLVGALDDLRIEALTEGDGVGLLDTTTLDTARVGLLVQAVQDDRAGGTQATGHTHHPQRGAVYLDDLVVGYTTLLVETVDVLGDESMQAIGEMQGGKGPVGGVGFGFSCLVGAAPQPHLS